MSRLFAPGNMARGFSLIEVLIAVAVLGIGLLAVAALQLQGVRQNVDSYARSQAILIANDYAERMFANKPGVDLGAYAPFDSNAINCNAAFAGPVCGAQSDLDQTPANAPAPCTPAQMAAYDQFIVSCGYPVPGGRYGGIAGQLLQGRIKVACINAAGASAFNAGTGVPNGPPCIAPQRHSVIVTWVEQVTAPRVAANNGTDAKYVQQAARYQLNVQP